jgi:hypothetical protein
LRCLRKAVCRQAEEEQAEKEYSIFSEHRFLEKPKSKEKPATFATSLIIARPGIELGSASGGYESSKIIFVKIKKSELQVLTLYL